MDWQKIGSFIDKIGVPNGPTTSKLKPQSILTLTDLEKPNLGPKILELAKIGCSNTEIAEQLKKSRGAIQKVINQADVHLEGKSKAITPLAKSPRGKVRWNSPYGFMYERGRAVKHPQEFETLVLILKWALQEMNSRKIADHLNNKKLRPRLATRWDRCTVHRIIQWHMKHPKFLKEVLSWESKGLSK